MTAPGQVLGVHHVALSVTDLDRSLAWWRRLLDVDVALREAHGGFRAVVLTVRGTTVQVALAQHEANNGERFAPHRTGLDHLAFTVADRAELDGWVARLDDLGVEHSGAIDIPSGAILNLKDPDGIAVAFFWNRGPTAG